MRYLLDTCTFLWLAQKPDRLSPEAQVRIDDEDSELFLSDISIWEIILKHARGKIPLPDEPRIWIPRKLARHRLHSLPLSHAAIFRSGELPKIHADPFDRLLAAQALEEQMTVLSPDLPLSLLGAGRIW